MTTQFPDQLMLRETSYAIVAVAGTGLFDPAQHGLNLRWMSSACWRGIICTYRVADDRLVLDRFEAGMLGQPPSLFGREPTSTGETSFHSGETAFEQLEVPIEYTGSLLLGADYVARSYSHVGFFPAWRYADVVELVFDHGQVVGDRNLAGEMAELRARLDSAPARPGPGESVTSWIEQTFSLDYGFAWPGRDHPPAAEDPRTSRDT